MPRKSGKPSLEELLKLKRQEKPAPDFWERFDRELRTRQRRLLLSHPLDDAELGHGQAHRLRRWMAWGSVAACCCAAALVAPRFLDTVAPEPTEQLAASSTVKSESATRRTAQTSPTPRIDIPGSRSTIALIEIPAPPKPERQSAPSPKAAALADVRQSQSHPQAGLASSQERWERLLAAALSSTTPDPEWDADVDSLLAAASSGEDDIVSRYQHPLQEFGHDYRATRDSRDTPLDRLSSLARHSMYSDEGSRRWGIRLDTISLSF